MTGEWKSLRKNKTIENRGKGESNNKMNRRDHLQQQRMHLATLHNTQ